MSYINTAMNLATNAAVRLPAIMLGLKAASKGADALHLVASKVSHQVGIVKLYNGASKSLKGFNARLDFDQIDDASQKSFKKVATNALTEAGKGLLYATGSLVALVAASYLAGPIPTAMYNNVLEKCSIVRLASSVNLPFLGSVNF